MTEEQILGWADAFHRRTGKWPWRHEPEPIPEAGPSDTWKAVDDALRAGRRGLPGRSSLARLLARERGVRNQRDLPPFRIPEILGWADAHHARHGAWPNCRTGSIPEAPHETWMKVNNALRRGFRGLPGGSSLAQLLASQRGVRNIADLALINVTQILAWADAFHSRTGRWPKNGAGPIPEAPGENWQNVASALCTGLRGLPGGSTLKRLLADHRPVKHARRRECDS